MSPSLFSTVTAAGCLLLGGCAGAPHTANVAKSRFVDFGTNKVDYLVEGNGSRTIVFVHCWAGNSGFWREQVRALAGRARLILVDLPGHGQSDKPRTDYSMDLFANAVVAVMRDARVDKTTLVGHSMGVPVICRVYQQAPEKIAGLVAVDGLLRRPAMTPDQAEQFVAPFRTSEYREHTRQFIGSLFPVAGTETLRDRVVSDLLATPQHVMVGAMEGMFGPGRPDWDPKRVSVPVLVINAKNPMWTPEYETHARSLSSQSEYRVLEGVGHWIMLEKPAEFNAALLEMLGRFDLIAK